MPRPPLRSPEWLPYFEEVVRTSKLATEAATRMGYRGPGTVRYHMKRLGMAYPRDWSRRPDAAVTMQRHIPEVVIPTVLGRRWVAGLVQGETCIQSIYREFMDTVYLELDTAMVDPAPIAKLSEYFQLPAPTAPIRNHEWRPQWRKNIQGLRALRVLREITPFLLGDKLREAERALDFFSPSGNHRGCYRNGDIWPRSEFPLRSKRRGSNFDASLAGATGFEAEETSQTELALLPRLPIPEIIIPAAEDRSGVGGLVQGEGSILTHYAKSNDSTTLVVQVSMTDQAPVFAFSDMIGLPRPSKPKPSSNRRHRAKWWRAATGLRALRVLREIQPFLVGGKLKEAEKAIALFGPTGYHHGCLRAIDVFPPNEFPLRNHSPGLA
jgi:hypothetical protein